MRLTKTAGLLLCTVLFLLLTSCNMGFYWFVTGEDVEDRAQTMLELPSPDSGNSPRYSIVVITDIHFGSSRAKRRDEYFIRWFEQQVSEPDESLRPRFMICLGDSMDGGHQNEADDYNEFCTRVQQIALNAGLTDFKTYTIIGNHDLYNHGWKIWKENIYPYTSFYHFTTSATGNGRGFSWYFIDSANGTLGKPQLTALEEAAGKDPLPKIVLSHYPVYCDGLPLLSMHNTLEKNRLVSLFASSSVRVIFEGHAHMGGSYRCSSFEEHLIKSYLQSYDFSLVTLDEENGTVSHPELNFYKD